MVRLVFRPYTQVRKAICTSAHLRASTRVSPGFALLRHSSPSFGSQQVCSYSNLSQKIMVGRWCGQPRTAALPPVRLLALHGFSAHQLAYMLDSLVRVSRRVDWRPSASILSVQLPPGGHAKSARLRPRSGGRHRRCINHRVSPATPNRC
jgi:hypothetical protein